jgi:hypothetical protein
VADIFNEVDEEVRRERLQRLWDNYGHYLVALVVLVIAGVAAWRGWEYWQTKQAAELGVRFDAALTMSEEGKTSDAEAAFAKIATEGTSGYRPLARLQEAAELAKRDAKGAVALYDKLSADSSVPQLLRDLASVRAGYLLVDTAPLAELTQRLEPLTAASGAFRHSARELLALAAYRANDATAGKRWFDAISTDAETPQGLRTRIEVLQSLSTDASKS